MLGDVSAAFCQDSSMENAAVSADEFDLTSLMLTYQLQAEQFKEDFKLERQDHQRTKAQVQSLTTQWNSLHDELRQCQAKVRCGVCMWYRLQWRRHLFVSGEAKGWPPHCWGTFLCVALAE